MGCGSNSRQEPYNDGPMGSISNTYSTYLEQNDTATLVGQLRVNAGIEYQLPNVDLLLRIRASIPREALDLFRAGSCIGAETADLVVQLKNLALDEDFVQQLVRLAQCESQRYFLVQILLHVSRQAARRYYELLYRHVIIKEQNALCMEQLARVRARVQEIRGAQLKQIMAFGAKVELYQQAKRSAQTRVVAPRDCITLDLPSSEESSGRARAHVRMQRSCVQKKRAELDLIFFSQHESSSSGEDARQPADILDEYITSQQRHAKAAISVARASQHIAQLIGELEERMEDIRGQHQIIVKKIDQFFEVKELLAVVRAKIQ